MAMKRTKPRARAIAIPARQVHLSWTLMAGFLILAFAALALAPRAARADAAAPSSPPAAGAAKPTPPTADALTRDGVEDEFYFELRAPDRKSVV